MQQIPCPFCKSNKWDINYDANMIAHASCSSESCAAALPEVFSFNSTTNCYTADRAKWIEMRSYTLWEQEGKPDNRAIVHEELARREWEAYYNDESSGSYGCGSILSNAGRKIGEAIGEFFSGTLDGPTERSRKSRVY